MEKMIKEFNLCTTGVISFNDLSNTDNLDKYDVDYKNSISLYDVINMLNNLYLKFIIEARKLDPVIYNGKVYEFSNASIYKNSEAFIEFLNTDGEVKKIYSFDDDGKVFSRVVIGDEYDFVNRKMFDNKSNIKLMKEYLELIKKNKAFIETYLKFLKCPGIYGDTINLITIGIGSDDIFRKNLNFDLYVGVFEKEFFEYKYVLGKNFDKSLMHFSNSSYDINDSFDFVKKFRVSKNLLPDIYK